MASNNSSPQPTVPPAAISPTADALSYDDPLTSASVSSPVDKEQLDKIHTSASQSGVLTTFNDFAPPPGSLPAVESKASAGDLVQQGLSGLYSRFREAVGVGKSSAQEITDGIDNNDTVSKKSSNASNVGGKGSSLSRGESGVTGSTQSSSLSEASMSGVASSGITTAESQTQAPHSSKASSIANMTPSKSSTASSQSMPKIVKATLPTAANPTVVPVTVSAFRERDASRGPIGRIEDPSSRSMGRKNSSKLTEGTLASNISSNASVESVPISDRITLSAKSMDGTIDTPLLSPAKSTAEVRSPSTSRAAPAETLKMPAVIDRINSSKHRIRSSSSSLEPSVAEPSNISTSAHDTIYHDSFAHNERPQKLRSGAMRIPGTTTNEGAPEMVNARLESMRKQVLSKEFWMADDTCKECFLCGTTFSAFRRKHHCRTCGCIFDAKCTSIITGEKFGVQGSLRVCKTCLDIINRRYESGSDDSADESYLPAIFRPNQAKSAASLPKPKADDDMSISERPEYADDSRSATTPMMAIPATRRVGEANRNSAILEIDMPQLSRPSSSRSLGSMSSARPQSSSHRRHHSKHNVLTRFRATAEERVPFRKAVNDEFSRKSKLPAFHDDNIIDPDLAPYMSDESSGDEQINIFASMSGDVPASSLDPEKSNLGPFLSSGRKHRFKQGEKSTSGMSFTSRGPHEDGNAAPSPALHPRPPRRRNMSTASASVHYLRSPRPKSGLFKGPSASVETLSQFENPAPGEAGNPKRSNSSRNSLRNTEPRQPLNSTNLRHVKKLLRQMLADAQIPNSSAWERALIPILVRCTDDVAPKIRHGDDMDIRHFIKLKKIPGGRPSDTAYVQGIVFTKNLALKSMPRTLYNDPKILLISFPIEYQRQPEQHFMSLQPVIEQEKEFLRMVVNRIINLRPQVLLAEKGVSGVALQFLSEANIAVAYNVKPSVIEAIARITHADIISSLDMLALPANVGSSKNFEVKTYVNNEIPGKKKTYMFVTGNNPELGCTINLRGASSDVLRRMKRITEFMAYVVYNLKLETCLMMDELIHVPEEGSVTSSPVPSTPRQLTDETMQSETSNGNTVTSLSSADSEKGQQPPQQPPQQPLQQQEPQMQEPQKEQQQQQTAQPGDDVLVNGESQAESPADPPAQLGADQADQADQVKQVDQTDQAGQAGQGGETGQAGLPDHPDREKSMVSLHESHASVPQESQVPEDVPMPTYYSDMVAKYETRILSASPFVKFTQPYHLMKAREQERRLVYFKRLRDQDMVEEHGENEKAKPQQFQLIKPEMVHELGQKAPRQIMEVLHAVHDAEYDKALHNYQIQTRQWEGYIQGGLDLFDPCSHQNIVVLYSVTCTATSIPCSEPQLIAMEFYNEHVDASGNLDPDCTLGQYIEDLCDGAESVCHANSCYNSMYEHHRTYVHDGARMTVFVQQGLPPSLPRHIMENVKRQEDEGQEGGTGITMWTYCKCCNKEFGGITMSEQAWKYSFGKYLELSFWGRGLRLDPKKTDCTHDHQTDHLQYFYYHGNTVRIHYDPIDLYEIIVPRARITWKVENDLKLKNDIFTRAEERWNRFMESVKERLKSIRTDSVLPEKADNCKAEIERLMKKVQEEQPKLTRKLQEVYMNSKYYEVIPLNRVVREMLELAAEWDAAFTKFEADFLSDKDVRQLTIMQLKKIFTDESKESLPSTEGSTTLGSESEERTPITAQTSMSELEEKPSQTSTSDGVGSQTSEGLSQPSEETSQPAEGEPLSTSPVPADAPADVSPKPVTSPRELPPGRAGPMTESVEPLDLATPVPPPAPVPPVMGTSPALSQEASDEASKTGSRAIATSESKHAAAPASLPPTKPAESGQAPPHAEETLQEKVERLRREQHLRALANEGSSRSGQNGDNVVETPRPTPDRGSSRRAGLTSSPPLARALTQPVGTLPRVQSSIGKLLKEQKGADSGDLMTRGGPTTEALKSEKKFTDRIGLGALKNHRKAGTSGIPRYVHGGPKKRESKVSALARHFEQLSREFERERIKDRKQRAANMPPLPRAFLPRTSTTAIVEVYEDVDQAVREPGPSDDDHLFFKEPSDAKPTGEQELVSPTSKTAPAKSSAGKGKTDVDKNGEEGPTATEPPSQTSQHTEETAAEAEMDNETRHGSQAGSDDEGGISDADQSSLTLEEVLSDVKEIAESLEPSGEIPEELPKHQKKSVMNILTNFWAERSASNWPQLEYPLKATDHIFIDSDVVVREDEPSSLVAFVLGSEDYKNKLAEIRRQCKMSTQRESESSDEELVMKGGSHGGGGGGGDSAPESGDGGGDSTLNERELEKSLLRSTGTHLKYQYTQGSAKMLCKILYAEQFDALRRKCGVADRIIESLSRCLKWDSRGGKTKSVFLKTLDDRLVMKSLSPIETAAFTRFAPAYFGIMAEALFRDLPTVIAKMLGFFQVIIRNPLTNTEIRLDLLVMENLFYDRSPSRTFDLKGSMRNRKIQSTGEQNEVLLDENMVEYIYESPLFAREHSKWLLRASVWNDTLFLARQNVMDYSLMIAVDEARKELVVGIIDCIRTYTWDKRLESWIKDRGFAGGGRNRPTVTSPKEYKSRFREAMARYILQAPNCWHEFGNTFTTKSNPGSSTRARFEGDV